MPVPVLSVAQMREWEAATWATGQTEAEVIRRVGSQLARRVHQLTGANDSILILAGKGHNGDDVRAAREFLVDRQVSILDLLAPETDLAHVEKALQAKPALVIDGLFGIGLNRPLDEAWQKIIGVVNAAKIRVLAVDVPSGLNADTGEIFGACIEAAITLTVGAPKIGMLASVAWPFVGRLEVADDVALIPCPPASELKWTLPEDFENFPPPRAVAGHKGSYGHVSILAGSLGYHGAAVIAARGAQRAQPGLVTVFAQEDIYYPVAGQLQSAMVSLWQADPKKMSTGFDALLVGPGLAGLHNHMELRHALRHWFRDYPNPLIVDASALDLLTPEPFLKKYIRVLTPHPGEAGRLLGWPVPKVQADRVKALREISKKFGGAWVILKGHQTLTGCAEGDIFVNPSGNPHLGQGGSGDLLSGFLAGLLAQPELQAEVAKTLHYAVWEHGAAADKLQGTRANWMVEDLAVEIGNAR
ncbi:MAG TPA: NAD(P)H-hydrate dehydratase [Verrucomicrobiae bacterium]|nr:NAD(P)H-hydrate dehydratase [Verrucomicrobiae bacterium]